MYEFGTRTGKFIIDHSRCAKCSSYVCVDACRVYGRNILKIVDGRVVLAIDSSEASRLCNECLSCEEKCRLYGRGAITIQLQIPGLESYRMMVKE